MKKLKINCLLFILLFINIIAIGQNKRATAKNKVSSKKIIAKAVKNEKSKNLYGNLLFVSFLGGGTTPHLLNYKNGRLFNGVNIPYKTFEIIDNQSVNYSLFYIGYNSRYVIKKLSKDQTICIEISPSLDANTSNFGLGSIELPIFISYNFGAASNYNCKRKKGFAIGLGMQYLRLNVIEDNSGGSSQNNIKIKNNYIQKIAVINYRFLNRKK
jgi:hypothetical protein